MRVVLIKLHNTQVGKNRPIKEQMIMEGSKLP